MSPSPPQRFLLAVERPELVPAVEQALRAAEVPYEKGLQAEPSPMVVFLVPEPLLDRARVAVSQFLGVAPPPAPDEEDATEPLGPREPAQFPWVPSVAALALVTIHLVVLFGIVGRSPTPMRLVDAGGLVRQAGAFQPWRLVTSLFVHVDLEHVISNALSMVVFAIPVIGWLGYPRALAVYLAAGVVGGSVALAVNPAGVVTIGSSGAVAGRFGAWLALTLRAARRAPMTRRALVRAIGIGLLVLPALVTPRSESGRSISVESHLGGAATGLVLGAAASRRGPDP